jgi:hypothetical protein
MVALLGLMSVASKALMLVVLMVALKDVMSVA